MFLFSFTTYSKHVEFGHLKKKVKKKVGEILKYFLKIQIYNMKFTNTLFQLLMKTLKNIFKNFKNPFF